jgi:HAMP domain-containing protein
MSVKRRLHAAIDAMTEPEATATLQSLADASGDPVAWMLDHVPPEPPMDDEVEALARFDAEHKHAAGSSTISADKLKQSLDIE